MRLLLDKMWSHEIALQLRRRDYDVVAGHRAGARGLLRQTRGRPRSRARAGGRRAVVTDNVGDFERARIAFERTGQTNYGLIYGLAPQFNRNLGAGVIGPMVRALDGLLRDHPEHDPYNLAVYLRRDT